ncbi:MAG: VWA domain-containing protein [Lachnospiraceae bacterium]|nr:VWA domain-containing protein [Lachnospiraceae bacterium]
MNQWERVTAGDFSKSTRKRLPICFCIDASGSMMAPTSSQKTRMQELNEAFGKFMGAMKTNEDVAASADISIVTFGGEPEILQPFAPIKDMIVPEIRPVQYSVTPLGEAIQVGLKLLEVRKDAYKKRGMKYFQPWLVVFTDGEPEGPNAAENMEIAIRQTTELERNNKLVVFNIGIGSDVNFDILKRLSVKREKAISVDETNLDGLFNFLGASSDSIVNNSDNTDILYGKETVAKGEEIDISEWTI